MKLLRLLVVSLTLAACGGGSDPDPTPDSQTPQDTAGGATCTNADYDPCTDNTQCDSGNCHLFQQSGFQVCVGVHRRRCRVPERLERHAGDVQQHGHLQARRGERLHALIDRARLVR